MCLFLVSWTRLLPSPVLDVMSDLNYIQPALGMGVVWFSRLGPLAFRVARLQTFSLSFLSLLAPLQGQDWMSAVTSSHNSCCFNPVIFKSVVSNLELTLVQFKCRSDCLGNLTQISKGRSTLKMHYSGAKCMLAIELNTQHSKISNYIVLLACCQSSFTQMVGAGIQTPRNRAVQNVATWTTELLRMSSPWLLNPCRPEL